MHLCLVLLFTNELLSSSLPFLTIETIIDYSTTGVLAFESATRTTGEKDWS